MAKNDIIFLYTSCAADIEEAQPALEARGYQVKSAADAVGLMRYYNWPQTKRNMQFAMTHTMLMCHLVVLHRDMDPADAVRAIAHCRAIGVPVIHHDELPFQACEAAGELIDAADLAYYEPSLREQLGRVMGRVTNDILRAERWLNKLLGDGLKNPMVREHRQAEQAHGHSG